MAENNHQDAAERSNVETLGMQHGQDNPRGPQHSGEGRLGENILVFVVAMAIFCFGIFSLGFYPDGGWIWWTVSTLLLIVSWFIVFHLLPSKTNNSVRQSGTELTQL
ncbi:hypothetical protein [uncultured Rothia sp.]|uniref:hypothetical protein n=1 Tax=uncultured Rothia sp. TaxID=316088 RepID=UPI0032170303